MLTQIPASILRRYGWVKITKLLKDGMKYTSFVSKLFFDKNSGQRLSTFMLNDTPPFYADVEIELENDFLL